MIYGTLREKLGRTVNFTGCVRSSSRRIDRTEAQECGKEEEEESEASFFQQLIHSHFAHFHLFSIPLSSLSLSLSLSSLTFRPLQPLPLSTNFPSFSYPVFPEPGSPLCRDEGVQDETHNFTILSFFPLSSS